MNIETISSDTWVFILKTLLTILPILLQMIADTKTVHRKSRKPRKSKRE